MQLMKVTCDPQCGFMMQDHDKKELEDFVKKHAEQTHQMKMSDKDVDEKIEYVS